MTEHPDEKTLRRRYQLLPGLQRKHATVDAYLAHERAEAAGPAPVAPAPVFQADAAHGNPTTSADGWRSEYESSLALRAEFPTVDTYVAFRRAESAGRVRVLAPLASSAGQAGRAPAPASAIPTAAIPTPDAIEADYRASADLQREFNSLAAYSAWRRHAAAGRATVTGGRVVSA